METLRPGEAGPLASREATLHNQRRAAGTRVACPEVVEVSLPALAGRTSSHVLPSAPLAPSPICSDISKVFHQWTFYTCFFFFSWIKEKSQPYQMRILGGWVTTIIVYFVMWTWVLRIYLADK